MILKTALCVLFFHALPAKALAQADNYTMSRSFTVADGLPSNHVYACVEDDHGFLWIATDAGIARFDGRNFQVFTTLQGLPDDEVLNVVKENNGRIWVNCFKQSPAYFDEAKNRFVNARTDSCLAKVSGTNLIYLSALPGGGVMYNNERGSFIFQDHKLSLFAATAPGGQYPNITVEQLGKGDFISVINNAAERTVKLLRYHQQKIIDSTPLLNYNNTLQLNYCIGNHDLYIQKEDRRGYYIISNIKATPLSYEIDSIDMGQQVTWLSANQGYISVVCRSGESMIFDRQHKMLRQKFRGDYAPNSVYHDRQGNIWISSIDKGLYLYKKTPVYIIPLPDSLSHSFFLSIARKPGGAILAGNYFGRVVEAAPGSLLVHTLPPGYLPTAWQRKIIFLQGKVFSFSEGGSYINYEQPLLNEKKAIVASKTAAVINDSLLVEGSFGQLRLINAKTNRSEVLQGLQKRATALCVAPGPMIYHGSTDGLYKYDYLKKTDIELSSVHPLLSERVTALTVTADGILWVGTASNGVLQLRNDTLLNTYTRNNGMLSNTVKCLAGGRPGELWVGTNAGISIIHYTERTAPKNCENVTVCDGLSSNIINEMLFSNDSVFCATASGICVLPAAIQIPVYDIPVRLTRIMVNNTDTVIASSYRLRYDENYLRLQFAGIEPGGHFDFFQYKLNEGQWNDLEGNTLDLQLNSGRQQITVRAVNLNGQYSTRPLLLSFHVAIPFWRSPVFWVLLLAALAGLWIWMIRRRDIAKRELALQAMLTQKRMADLELQALKSQIDPHFIFNCLNSIKMLNHKQQYGVAEDYLDRFAALLRSALEQSSIKRISLQQEIDFISNYLALEKLRFPNRLFYQVEVDSNIDETNILIPSMLLQPYIENSIKHGIGPLKDRPGIITVRFKLQENMLLAEVEDNGRGISETEARGGGNGIGLLNTQRRCSFYNIEYSIKNITGNNRQVCGTVVSLLVPLQLLVNKKVKL